MNGADWTDCWPHRSWPWWETDADSALLHHLSWPCRSCRPHLENYLPLTSKHFAVLKCPYQWRNQSVGQWMLKWRKSIFLSSKRKKKSNMQIVKICCIEKIVCILNGVCCAIVHLHCINVKHMLLTNLTYEQSAKMWHACLFVCFFSSWYCTPLKLFLVLNLKSHLKYY